MKKIKENIRIIWINIFAPFLISFEIMVLDYRLRRLQAIRSIDDREYGILMDKSRRNREEFNNIFSEYNIQMSISDEVIHRMYERIIRKKSEKYFIPLPQFEAKSEKYVELPSGRYILSLDELNRLRGEIRKERDARMSGIITIVTMLMGLVGTLTGLVSVIINK